MIEIRKRVSYVSEDSCVFFTTCNVLHFVCSESTAQRWIWPIC